MSLSRRNCVALLVLKTADVWTGGTQGKASSGWRRAGVTEKGHLTWETAKVSVVN